MDYIITGSVLVNNILFFDGSKIENIMGGGGIYSFSGIYLFTDKSILAAPVGEDFEKFFGNWWNENKMSRKGLSIVDKYTMNTVLTYLDSYGNYTDKSRYTEEDTVFHSEKYLPGFEFAIPHVGYNTKGVLVTGFETLDERLVESKSKYNFKLMWEAPRSVGKIAEKLETFERSLEYCDIYSINKSESFDLFDISSEEVVIERLMEYGKPCLYRLGSKGSCILTKDNYIYVPAVVIDGTDQSIDPTGCGNVSVSAAMWAFCEGFNPLKTAITANVAAGFNASQYGPIPIINDELRAEVLNLVDKIYADSGISEKEVSY
ncbi:MAG: hypothetical protein GX928_06600 [Ruminococcaceae bacterium]|nr:hypothetical protein [Oscillospiraceae bacterium]